MHVISNVFLFCSLRSIPMLCFPLTRPLCFLLQLSPSVLFSATHPPDVVAARVFAFLKDFATETLPAMDLDEFREQCEGVVMGKLEKPRSLAEEASEFWDPISNRRVHKHRGTNISTGSTSTLSPVSDEALRSSRLEAAAISKVSKQHVEAALHRWLLGPQAACLQVHVVGRAFMSGTFTEAAEGPVSEQKPAPKPPPSPGAAKVTITDVLSSEVRSVWEGPVEDCAVPLGEEEMFPCFVSSE